MNTKQAIDRISYAIYHQPELIPVLFKDTSIPKGLLYSRLRRVVPHKVGIEFEGIGEFIIPYYIEHKDELNITNINKADEIVAKHLGVESIKCDTMLSEYLSKHRSQVANLTSEQLSVILKENLAGRRKTQEEVRICISDFRQLINLYWVLELMKKYITIPIKGGIHIHIDLTQYIRTDSTKKREIIKEYLSAHLKEVEQIFPRYRGNFNSRKVGNQFKGTYINISYLNTLEFRIAPLTHDYSELIKWIEGCCKFTSKVISQCHLRKLRMEKDINAESVVCNLRSTQADVNEDDLTEESLTSVISALQQNVIRFNNSYYIVDNGTNSSRWDAYTNYGIGIC